MTDEQKKEHIAALLREREGYARYGRKDKVAEVDAVLDLIQGKAPAKRATKLSPKKRTEL